MAELWKELHERAYNFKGKDDKIFLLEFSKKIPTFTKGCRCREFWLIYVRNHPPVFGENREYFNWTVNLHNEVNKKLGKSIISLEEAKKLYQK